MQLLHNKIHDDYYEISLHFRYATQHTAIVIADANSETGMKRTNTFRLLFTRGRYHTIHYI